MDSEEAFNNKTPSETITALVDPSTCHALGINLVGVPEEIVIKSCVSFYTKDFKSNKSMEYGVFSRKLHSTQRLMDHCIK